MIPTELGVLQDQRSVLLQRTYPSIMSKCAAYGRAECHAINVVRLPGAASQAVCRVQQPADRQLH